MIFKLAWRNLWRNKRRTLITAASIFFAVLLAVIMRSFQEGSYNKMIENIVSFYTGYVQIHKEGYWDDQNLDNSFNHAPTLKATTLSHTSVKGVVPRLESFALAASQDVTEGCLVVGIEPTSEDMLTALSKKVYTKKVETFDPKAVDSIRIEYQYDPAYYLASGEQAALVAGGLAEKLKLDIGDTIILIGQGYHGVSAAGKYPIKALVKFGSPDLNKRLVYLPLKAAQQLYGAEERLTSFALLIDEPQRATKLVQNLRQDIDESYEIMDWKEMMPELVQTIEGDRAGGIIMMLILYLIIGFGIFGTVLMMVAERRFEFGVLIAIGMKRMKLAAVVIIETILISILGILAGSIASLPIVMYFHINPLYMESMASMYEEFGMEPVLPTAIQFSIYMNQALFVLLISLFVCIYPLWKINRTEAVEAMRG